MVTEPQTLSEQMTAADRWVRCHPLLHRIELPVDMARLRSVQDAQHEQALSIARDAGVRVQCVSSKLCYLAGIDALVLKTTVTAA